MVTQAIRSSGWTLKSYRNNCNTTSIQRILSDIKLANGYNLSLYQDVISNHMTGCFYLLNLTLKLLQYETINMILTLIIYIVLLLPRSFVLKYSTRSKTTELEGIKSVIFFNGI